MAKDLSKVTYKQKNSDNFYSHNIPPKSMFATITCEKTNNLPSLIARIISVTIKESKANKILFGAFEMQFWKLIKMYKPKMQKKFVLYSMTFSNSWLFQKPVFYEK